MLKVYLSILLFDIVLEVIVVGVVKFVFVVVKAIAIK